MRMLLVRSVCCFLILGGIAFGQARPFPARTFSRFMNVFSRRSSRFRFLITMRTQGFSMILTLTPWPRLRAVPLSASVTTTPNS